MFLYTKPNALNKEVCREIIQTFELSTDRQQKGQVYTQSSEQNSNIKDSMDMSFIPEDLKDPIWGRLLCNIVDTVEKGLEDYKIRFQMGLTRVDPFRISQGFNIQRYKPSQAFHGYHCERAGLYLSERILVWMIYLNDITDGGETEFFYQHHFERPEEGKLVIWPSDWTYTHRGIPSPTQTKYIITGWIDHFRD
jgi:hypothetical protein